MTIASENLNLLTNNDRQSAIAVFPTAYQDGQLAVNSLTVFYVFI
ncbi:MAG: hypothetical protein AAFV28_08975 [Cyanobacteria bacterium J06635_13]